jgi:2-oxoglutarate ferredoxin oxidoreductase subunit gamma
MENSYLLAGFGGQGIQTLGQLMVYAANEADKAATYLPAYGGEMRGGTSNCTVKISADEIGAPAAKSYDYVVVLNMPSYNRFKDTVKPSGTLIVNSSLIADAKAPEEVKLIEIDLSELSKEAGSALTGNIIMLGLLCAYVGDIPQEAAKEVMLKKMGKKEEYIAMNSKAFDLGVRQAKAYA